MYASKLAHALEAAGLVARRRDANEPRVMQLSLTGQGCDVTQPSITVLRGLLDQSPEVTPRAVVVAGQSLGRDELVGDVRGSLKTDESIVRGTIEELAAMKLLEEDAAVASRIRLTAAGRKLYESTSEETA